MNEPTYCIGVYTTFSSSRDPVVREHWTPIVYAYDHLSAGRAAKALSKAEDLVFSIRVGDAKPYVWYRHGNSHDY